MSLVSFFQGVLKETSRMKLAKVLNVFTVGNEVTKAASIEVVLFFCCWFWAYICPAGKNQHELELLTPPPHDVLGKSDEGVEKEHWQEMT